MNSSLSTQEWGKVGWVSMGAVGGRLVVVVGGVLKVLRDDLLSLYN